MDFYSLSRKDLQSLCKKNKIPANITNLAMADALAALDQVEGLDEFLNSREDDAGTPNVRTAVRASTQRKPGREEVEGSKVSVSVSKKLQRGARVAERMIEQENKDANVLTTPAPVGSRRRATAVSTRRKKEVEMVEEDADKNGVQEKPSAVANTPAAAPVSRRRATARSVCTKIETAAGTSVQRAYSTRRSVRLLGKDLSKMSLMDTEDNVLVKIHDDVSQDLSNMSEQVEDLSDAEKGASLQTASTVVSDDTVGLEYQSHDSGSDVKSVSVTENDMVVESHVSNEAEPEAVKCLELDAKPHASNEAGSELLEESGDSSELDNENKECFGAGQETFAVVASEDAVLEVTGGDTTAVTVVVPDVDDQVSNESDDNEDNYQDVIDSSVSLKELVDCNMDEQVINEGEDKEVKNNESHEEASTTCEQSENAGSRVEIENNESIGVMQDVLPSEASEDTLLEVTEQDTATLTVVVPDVVTENMESEAQAYKYDEPEGIEDIMLDAENLESHAHAEESEDPLGGEDIVLDADNAFSSILDVEAGEYMNSSENMEADAKAEESEEPAAGEDDLVEADVKAEESEEPEACEDDLEKVDNALSSGDVVSGNTAIPNQEIMTEDSINEQQITDIPVKSVVSDQLKGDVHNTNMMQENVTSNDLHNKSMRELRKMLKGDVHNTNMMKENVTSNDLHNKSMRELRKMLKEFTLDGKSNCKTNNDVKEVEKKRTALQALPQNRTTADEAQIDG